VRQKRWLQDLESVGGAPNFHRLCSVFLAGIGTEETKIEASFSDAIKMAKEQKVGFVRSEKRAEETCAKYSSEKASASEGPPFRLPLC